MTIRYYNIYMIISKLVTILERDSKAPFSIATMPRCKRECYSFPWISPL